VVEDSRRTVDAGWSHHVFNVGDAVLPNTDAGLITELATLVQSL
jgi:uroporphyrinogen decarboxylase